MCCAHFHVQELCSGDLTQASTCGSGSVPLLLHGGKMHKTNFNGILQLAKDIALGLQHIHQRGIIHGDLNPRNVLIKLKPAALPLGCVAKIADFGLAVRLPAGASCVEGIKHGTVS